MKLRSFIVNLNPIRPSLGKLQRAIFFWSNNFESFFHIFKPYQVISEPQYMVTHQVVTNLPLTSKI